MIIFRKTGFSKKATYGAAGPPGYIVLKNIDYKDPKDLDFL
jgi:hypothetical protein